MTLSTVSETGAKRAFNFNAGPGALPLPVLENPRRVARLRRLRHVGDGNEPPVARNSRRSTDKAEEGLRRALAIPEEYSVLFLQGGGSLQFAMVPMNLFVPGKPVDVLNTGSWTAKAMEELKKIAEMRLAASTEADKFTRVPRKSEISFAANASYVHMCTNNTIEGTQWSEIPDTAGVPLVADMSSDILSRPMDVKRFGLIFAGAQKNLGPSGVTVVDHPQGPRGARQRQNRQDSAISHARQRKIALQHAAGVRRVCAGASGGLGRCRGRRGRNREGSTRARRNCSTTRSTPAATTSARSRKESRSKMNVVFRVAGGDEAVEKKFAKEGEAAGLIGIKGHRSVGGMRASIYNAVPFAAVEALVSFMKEFERKNG